MLRAMLSGPASACLAALAATAPIQIHDSATDNGPQFAARRERTLPAKPEGLLAADFDGDGRAELLAVTQDPGVLHAIAGTGEGRTWPLGSYPLAPQRLEAPWCGGSAVVIACRGDSTLHVIDPLAGGAELWRLDLARTPRAIATGSGRVAIACDGRELLLIGQDQVVRTLQLSADLPRCALMLATGEGVVIGFQDTRRIQFYGWEGAGGPGWSADLAGIPRDFAEADLDGDGDLELACVSGDRSLWVFGWGERGAGPVPFTGTAPVEWHTQAVPYSLNAFAFGRRSGGGGTVGNTASDLVVVHASDLAWLVLGDHTATGPRLRRSAYAGQTPRGSAVGDFDGDGLADLAIANRDSLAISMVRGVPVRGPGRSSAPQSTFAAGPRTPVGGFPNSIAAGDLDGDGLPEILVLNSKDDTMSVLPNRARRPGAEESSQVFGPAITLPVGPSPRSITSADLDADGRGDAALILVDGNTSRVRLFFGRGPGNSLRLEPGTEDLALGRSGTDLKILDLDRDGDLDLLAADPLGNVLVWWTQGPAGSFTEAGRLELPGGPRAIAALGPPRGAGAGSGTGVGANRSLLAIALSGPGEPRGVAFFEVRPRGDRGEKGLEIVPSDSIGHIDTGGSPQDIETADFNGDGRPDIALLSRDTAGSPRGNVRILFAQDNGGFEVLPSVRTSMEPRSLVLADPDLDGRTDLFVTAQFSHVINVWTIAGAVPTTPTGLLSRDHLGAGVGCLDLVPADVNGDGRTDLVVANAHTDDVSVLVAE